MHGLENRADDVHAARLVEQVRAAEMVGDARQVDAGGRGDFPNIGSLLAPAAEDFDGGGKVSWAGSVNFAAIVIGYFA